MSDLKGEFKEFMQTPGAQPPASLSSRVRDGIVQRLNPSQLQVFARLAAIHAISGAITLMMCPQFGFRLIGEGMGISHYFMFLGEVGCIVACGVFFLGTSALVAALALKPEEVRAVRRHELLQISSVVFLSLGVFAMLRAEIVLGFAIAWIVGSVLGGIAMLELGWRVRRWALAQ